MFINYLRIASRNIRKHKVYSLINIAGLSIGITCCIMIMLYVKDELSYDQFHRNKDFIYRVTSEKNIGNNSYFSPRPPFPIGDMLKERFPQVKTYTIFGENYYCRIQRGDDVFLTDNMATVNPSFFEIFTFSFIAGDAKTALNDPLSVVITESFAKKLFNSIDVIGKTINIDYEDRKVTGVIHDIPYHSHLQFELVIPIKWDWTKIKEQRLNDNNFWGGMGNLIYVMLNQKVQLKDFNRKIRDIIKEYNPRVSTKIFLQPLDRVYLYSNFLMEEHEAEESADMITGDINNLYILSLSAFGILLIACMNFMNLSTAIAGRRAKEIGLRKICGSQKRDILRQFLGESIILAFLSLVLALVLVDLLLPVFNLYTGKQLSSQGLFHWEILLGIMAVTLFTGLLSGSYPAFFLSSFNPVNLFKKGGGTPNPFMVSQMALFRDFISKVFRKNKVSEGINKKYLVPGVKNRFSLRKLLIVFQFSIAIVIIICTTVFFKQLDFMQSKYAGLDLENTIVVVERVK